MFYKEDPGSIPAARRLAEEVFGEKWADRGVGINEDGPREAWVWGIGADRPLSYRYGLYLVSSTCCESVIAILISGSAMSGLLCSAFPICCANYGARALLSLVACSTRTRKRFMLTQKHSSRSASASCTQALSRSRPWGLFRNSHGLCAQHDAFSTAGCRARATRKGRDRLGRRTTAEE